MNYYRWLKITLFSTAFVLAIAIALNIAIDTYGVYLSLFNTSRNKKLNTELFFTGFNQRIYNPEFIFRNAERYDSFLFGTSKVSVIDTNKIRTGNFFNMSYPQGVPEEHLAIIKSFLKKGIKIKNIIIGLDEFSFKLRCFEDENRLLMIMHPDVTGKKRATIFLKYFFRYPRPFELSNAFDYFIKGNVQLKTNINESGLNMGWLNMEKEIALKGKPLFQNEPSQYTSYIFDQKLVDDVFSQIDEMKALAIKYHFSIIFFLNPMHAQLYANYAEGLLPIKKELARHTDFYDFSGFNSVTTNNLSYYEDQHYRYLVGDMIINKIFNDGNISSIPRDFGLLVTGSNVADHIKKQKRELEKYKEESKLKK